MIRRCERALGIRYKTIMAGFIAASMSMSATAEDFKPITDCKHSTSRAALEQCLENAQNYAIRNKDNALELEKAARYIQEFDSARAALVYDLLIKNIDAKVGCEKGLVTSSAMHALLSENSEIGAAGIAIATTCYSWMEKELRSELRNGFAVYQKRVCPLLESKKALRGLDAKRCKALKS